MPPRSARRLGVLTTALLLTVGLLAPVAASAAPTGRAASLGERGSAFGDGGGVRAFANDPIEVRDLSDACPKGRVPAAGFRDVASSYDFARAIDCLVWYEITQGKTATTYAPNDAVTRQQMAVFLHRTLEYVGIAELVEPPARSQFGDVPATGEVGEAINVLASDELADMLGVRIVAGKTATTFDPAGRVTRAQMGSFIARTLEGVAEFSGATIDRGRCDNVFSDEAAIPSTHRDNVKLLCSFGIVTGRADGTYGPGFDVNRGQMAAFLMRLMDVLVESRLSLPPDAFVEVFVDRGSDVTACSDTGRDGSQAKPFCSIQAGIDHARSLQGYAVDVLVQPQVTPYSGDVILSSADAYGVVLASMSDVDPVDLDGSVRVYGASGQDLNAVIGFDITSASLPAIDVRSPGVVLLGENRLEAATAVLVNQTGFTWLFGSDIHGSDVGVDLVDTILDADLWGTLIAGNEFAAPFQAYVRAPGTVSNTVADAHLTAWLDEFENVFATDAVVGSNAGRRAIVPAP